jgi:cell division protein ZapE
VTALAQRYEALLAAGELREDRDQRAAVAVLDRLAAELTKRPKRGLVARLRRKPSPPAPRGVYMWGGVGRGKSMLMDLAFSEIAVEPKRRVHFHEFMLEVHGRLRGERAKEKGDPIPPVARAIAAEARLLAFDEMVINNSADAMILSRLFAQLLANKVTVITTSNRPPRDLYLGGLNRELFLPFIALVERELEVVPLNGPTDYRLERLGGYPTWYVPNGEAATRALSAAFFRLTDYPPEDRAHVPAEDIPVAGGRTLIDALHEHKVKLLAAADAEPHQLYEAGDGAFEFERTASRLMEMQSASYLAAGHGEGE